jgi:hypothetical protein
MDVRDLRPGMPVWSLDADGTRIAVPVRQVGSTAVPASHQVVRLVLSDGRTLSVSPGHPTADGRTIGQLNTNDAYDGAVVISAERVPYAGKATYDLLPDSATGFYWADGILLGSTLH